VCEELGAVNAPGPYVSTACLAVPTLVALGADDLVPALVDGSKRAAVVWDPAVVVDGQIADAFLFVEGDRVVWRERDDVDVSPHSSIDGTRRTATVTASAPGRDIGDAATLHFSGTAGVVDGATAALCAEMVGGMQRVLDTTVAYAKEREQFGRPVGSFQAVQHRLADMLLQTEAARSAAYYAAYTVSVGTDDAPYATSVAKAYCSEAARTVTGDGIQLHGGIGFTWEHDMHLYFKRATQNQTWLGDAAFHRERALQLELDRMTR
jgi:alkylation response protein AidB-like acyl-CoA dehydrogenase